MKKMGLLPLVILLCLSNWAIAQEKEEKQEERLSYYEKRGQKDASYEQALEMNSEEDEEDFWQDQSQYEKDLKKRDKKAYKAYMKGKKDAYAEHAAHCDRHCHHSSQYYHHTHFYYTYNRNYYPSRTAVRTNVRVAAPSLRVGIF